MNQFLIILIFCYTVTSLSCDCDDPEYTCSQYILKTNEYLRLWAMTFYPQNYINLTKILVSGNGSTYSAYVSTRPYGIGDQHNQKILWGSSGNGASCSIGQIGDNSTMELHLTVQCISSRGCTMDISMKSLVVQKYKYLPCSDPYVCNNVNNAMKIEGNMTCCPQGENLKCLNDWSVDDCYCDQIQNCEITKEFKDQTSYGCDELCRIYGKCYKEETNSGIIGIKNRINIIFLMFITFVMLYLF